MAKLTKTQEFARAWRDVEHDEQMRDFAAYRKRNHGVMQAATLRWFDAMSGEGSLQLADGSTLPAHFSSIEGVDKNNYCWPNDTDRARLATLGYNVPVIVTPYISYGSSTAEKIVIPSLK